MIPATQQKFPGGEQSVKEIFQNMDRAGYFQAVLDFMRRQAEATEKELRIYLHRTLIMDAESLAIVHKLQGRLSGYSMAVAKLEALAGRPKTVQPHYDAPVEAE